MTGTLLPYMVLLSSISSSIVAWYNSYYSCFSAIISAFALLFACYSSYLASSFFVSYEVGGVDCSRPNLVFITAMLSFNTFVSLSFITCISSSIALFLAVLKAIYSAKRIYCSWYTGYNYIANRYIANRIANGLLKGSLRGLV